ncbi:MAG: hypothetical protein DHS20C16_21030 [Phycisphaerae bacterium]|nr:MAG: hypothetical protein DHS20C16_21030 [Phycisphaerae bacterium]
MNKTMCPENGVAVVINREAAIAIAIRSNDTSEKNADRLALILSHRSAAAKMIGGETY